MARRRRGSKTTNARTRQNQKATKIRRTFARATPITRVKQARPQGSSAATRATQATAIRPERRQQQTTRQTRSDTKVLRRQCRPRPEPKRSGGGGAPRYVPWCK